MIQQLRACFWLLVLTLALCSVAYPLALLAIAQTPWLRRQAEGSLVDSKAGGPIGSRLIAQPFTGEEYFQPRPSAVNFNAAASGASNWAASNYLLRDRVARQLGPIVRYGADAALQGKKPGALVGPDIEKWFQQDRIGNKTGIVAQWAGLHPGLAEAWLKDADNALKPQGRDSDKDLDAGQSFMKQLRQDDWRLFNDVWRDLHAREAPSVAELADVFFPLFSSRHPGQWLLVEEHESGGKAKYKTLARVTESAEIQAIFFDTWRQEHPDLALEEVPADMVMASGSGLDPHITLKNAQYQLKYRVAAARSRAVVRQAASKGSADFAKLSEKDRQRIEEETLRKIERILGKPLEVRVFEVIGELLTVSAQAPLGGLAGVPLVNVLELNLAVDDWMRAFTAEI